MAKKVKVCKRCSNFDVKGIKAMAKDAGCKLRVGCISKCNIKEHPELDGKYFGLIDDELYSTSSKEEFYERMTK
ncbi:MAG: hypothetical protein QM793_06345 [Muricomes sp.]